MNCTFLFEFYINQFFCGRKINFAEKIEINQGKWNKLFPDRLAHSPRETLYYFIWISMRQNTCITGKLSIGTMIIIMAFSTPWVEQRSIQVTHHHLNQLHVSELVYEYWKKIFWLKVTLQVFFNLSFYMYSLPLGFHLHNIHAHFNHSGWLFMTPLAMHLFTLSLHG